MSPESQNKFMYPTSNRSVPQYVVVPQGLCSRQTQGLCCGQTQGLCSGQIQGVTKNMVFWVRLG